MTRALAHAKMAVDISELAGASYFSALYRSGYLQVLHERGLDDEAQEQIETILPLAIHYNSAPIQGICLLLSAQLAFDRGDEAKGLGTLREAFGLLATRGANFVLWWWRPGLLADLCVRALNAEIEIRYIRELIKALCLEPSELPVACRRWPWPITVKMLGPLEILINDEPMRFSGKAQQKPLDLLRILVAFGGEGVAVASVAEKLWPQADGDSAHCAFDVTLHRLRKLLGSDSAIVLSDGRLSLNTYKVWVDVFAFERLIDQIRKLEREGAAASGVVDTLAEHALLLYGGHFLEHEGDEPWMLPMRERLRQRFQNFIFRLGQALEQGGHWVRAERLYRRGLETDALAESLYQRLMVCHRGQGRRAEAMEVYRRCRTMLSVVLGASPSVETNSLFAVLQNG